MITDNTYYKADIYIPQAKPSISDDATKVDDDFKAQLDRYEEDCLIKCLGPQLYFEFALNIDSSKTTKLIDGVNEKWDWLVNGHSYVKSGETEITTWRGIRFKTPFGSNTYNTSFLAYYVFWYYEKERYLRTTTTGTGKPKNHNMEMVPPTIDVVNAWNKFVGLVQGKKNVGRVVYNNAGLFGIDYYNGELQVCLYQFIEDMNNLDDTIYPSFKPKQWDTVNQLGL